MGEDPRRGLSASNLDMFVLDVLRHDLEQLPSILKLLNAPDPIGWRDVSGRDYGEEEVRAALARLIGEGYVTVAHRASDKYELVPVDAPDLTKLDSYWLVLSDRGRAAWEKWVPPLGDLGDDGTLVGTRLRLVVNDPWQFVDASGSNVFSARISRHQPAGERERELLLLTLDVLVTHKGAAYTTLLAEASHNGVTTLLSQGESVELALVAIKDAPAPDEPLSTHAWRGGLAGRAEATLIAEA